MRSKKAFTLVEVMVVVLIVATIAAVAVPQWVTARGRSQQKGCMSQLRAIETAKEVYATEARLAPGDTVLIPDIWPSYIKGVTFPRCPGGGIYSIEPVGEVPTCSLRALASNAHKIL